MTLSGKRLAGALSVSTLLPLLFARPQGLAPAVAVEAERLIDATQGAYTERHQVRSLEGGNETTEDVVEIARVDPTHVLVRIVRQFDVGHSCNVFGVATFERDCFVYRTRRWLRDEDPTCTLRVRATPEGLSVTDRQAGGKSTCRTFCGERGSVSDFTSSWAHRRPIPNLLQLKRSEDYVEAMAEFNENMRVPR
jgi:hypothetical protein